MASRLQIAKNDIIALFDNLPQRVFWPSDISQILSKNRSFWRLAERTTTAAFSKFLIDKTPMKRVEVAAVNHASASDTVRYIWKEASPYEIAVSLKRNAYLCHATAMFLHGLTDQIPSRIFVNAEQSPKPTTGILTQEGIHKAFSHKQRESRFVFKFNDSEAVLIWGKNYEQSWGYRFRLFRQKGGCNVTRAHSDRHCRSAHLCRGGVPSAACVPTSKRQDFSGNTHCHAQEARLYLPLSSSDRVLYATSGVRRKAICQVERSRSSI